jgi:cellulose synthase/poly-beta-1,6-N-acetylglucosamine synthase-like glycosyltransferase
MATEAFAKLTEVAVPAPRPVVVALVPAHDEEAQIEAAIDSLRGQVSPPDLIVVCADNCTDRTAELAEAAGAIVFETVDNPHKKAGALNQVLELLLPLLIDEDAVLVMDADSILAPAFVSTAKRHLRDGVGGVGGVFTGRAGGGFVGMLQRNEYARYARDVARLKGKVLVLTGTATLFSAKTLRHVAWARAEGLLPGDTAHVYDTSVLTEDNELTLALLHLGYRVISPKECRLTTEVMGVVGRPLPAAPALEARRDREPPYVRPDSRDRELLGPPARDLLRDARDRPLPHLARLVARRRRRDQRQADLARGERDLHLSSGS